MKASKLLDKFRNWALKEPTLKRELDSAQEEFFASYGGDPAHADMRTVGGLFIEWFLFDRKTTSWLKTPAEIYLNYSGVQFSKQEKNSIRRCLPRYSDCLKSLPWMPPTTQYPCPDWTNPANGL